jgi:hypothetical protein
MLLPAARGEAHFEPRPRLRHEPAEQRDSSSTGQRKGELSTGKSLIMGAFHARSNVSGWVKDRTMEQRPQLEPPLPLAAIARDVSALCEAWAGSMPAMGTFSGGAQVVV